MNFARKFWQPSWPLLVALSAFASYLALGERLLGDPDTYLHIAAGRWIIAHGSIPTSDPFSHSLSNAPWTSHEWLAEIIFAKAYELGGWGGVVALTVAAGFASASFAQGTTPATPATSAVPAAKVAAPAPAAAEKKAEAPKAAEPAKVEAAKTEAAKADTGKPADKQGKATGHEKQEKHAKAEGKTEVKPETKAATAPAPAVK